MGLGEDVGSASIQIAKEITPEMAKILAKLIESTFSLAKGTGKLIWNVTLKEKYDEMQQEKQELKGLEKIRKNSGFVSLNKFMAQNDELAFVNLDEWIDSNKDIETLDKILKNYGIQCAFRREEVDLDGNGRNDLNVFCPKGKEQLFQEALKDFYQQKVNEVVMQQQYSEEMKENNIDLDYIDVVGDEQKAQISEIVNQRFENLNTNNPNWDNEKCFDLAWENATFENKSNELLADTGLTKKQQLINNINQLVKKDEDFIVVEGKVLMFKDEKENYHVIDLHNKKYVMFDEKLLNQHCKDMGMNIENPVKTLEESVKEAKITLKEQQYALESKYKDFSPEQQKFVKETMMLQAKNPNVNLSQIDDPNLDIRSMLFLREAQKMKMDITELLQNEYSAKQIQAFVKLKELESEVGTIQPQIYETFKDKTLTDKQIEAMLDRVIETPNISNEKLVETAEKVAEQQKRVDNIIDGVEEKQVQREDIDVAINEAKEVKAINEISKSKVVQEISVTDTSDLQQTYKQLPSDHADNRGDWKLYETENKFDYFINENNEIKAVCSIDEVEKTFKLDEALKKPPAFENGSGKWHEYSKLKNGKVLVNEKGKAKMETVLSKQKAMQLTKTKANEIKEVGQKFKNIKGNDR